MLMPKKVKYRKQQRGRMRGKAYRGSTLSFGQFGLHEVYLEVLEHNAPAIAVYRGCGFQPCGRRDNLLLMNLVS